MNEYFSVATELYGVTKISQVEGDGTTNQFVVRMSNSDNLGNIIKDLQAHPDVESVKVVKP
ncbi:MAG: hypothetical protein H6765_03000 [Candidatus Peribacteria bacterium]|nr:MAG: hypothetical protein H6765_03000 [Candidatus Peribacteria bacterium]